MAKTTTNGNIKVGWILDTALPIKRHPLAATLNTSALDLSPAVAWAEYEVGNASSGDIDDRAITDLGNVLSRGAATYGATLAMFRNDDNTDLDHVYVQAFEAFRVTRTVGWLIVRVNKPSSLPWEDGDEISLYKFIATTTADDTEGDDSTKFVVSFLQQGALFVHTMIGNAGVITGVPSTLALSIADGPVQLAPVLNGVSIVSRADYTSSDKTKARVSKGGTIVPLAAGTTTITVSYGAATAPVTSTVTVSA
jgi:hypothetical protein